MSFSFRELSYRYPLESAPAIEGITVEIPSGSVCALLGLSGSGKSTLLALCSLLIEPHTQGGQAAFQGTIHFKSQHRGGINYSDIADVDRHYLRLHEFGIVLQRHFLLPHFSCRDNIAMPLLLRGVPRDEARERANRLLTHTGMSSLANRLARSVSGGERQRLAVLRAIVHNPNVVFADEPVSNLDAKNAKVVLELLTSWRRGELMEDAIATNSRTLILVSHGIQSAWEYSDHFLVLKNGRLCTMGVQNRDSIGDWNRLSYLTEHGE